MRRLHVIALVALAVLFAALAGEILWGDQIMWGTFGGDQIIWGTSGDDHIIWGTLGAGRDGIIWGS